MNRGLDDEKAVLNNAKLIVEAARKKGLVHGPGERSPVKLNGAGSSAAPAGNGAHEATIEATVDGVAIRVRVGFMEITPALARTWLNANNRGNRALRETTVEAYARDMCNGDWLLNHQGIAFNDQDDLIDGQHRLAAIVQSGQAMTLLVTHGWPSATKTRAKLMDTVDRGAARSIADLLGLQHGIESPRIVVMTATAIVNALCRDSSHSLKMTAPQVLAVLEAFRDGVRFAVANRPTTRGLRQAPVLAAIALAFGPYPKETPDFLSRLVSGAGLEADNPILPLRNWLLSDAARKSQTTRKHQASMTALVLEHFRLWRTGSKASALSSDLNGLKGIESKQLEACEKVRGLFAATKRKEAA